MSKYTDLSPRFCKDDVFPIWGHPCRVGYFSVDSDRFFEPGHGNLRYFKHPEQFPLDLNVGWNSAKRKVGCPLDERIDHLLQFIQSNYSELMNKFDHITGDSPQGQGQGRTRSPLLPVEFVSWRGLLRLIMCTPFEYKQKWIIRVTRYKGTFYLSQVETDEAKNDRLNETELQRRMTSWGYKFEQYCLAKSPDDNPRTNVPVDECSEFSCIFYTKLQEKHNMLFGAEMDCIRCDQPVHLESKLPLDNLEFLELKTSYRDMNKQQTNSFYNYKIRNWWCQSFLVGIKEIVVGWRDRDGFVHSLQEIPVNQLPKKAKNWNPNKCAWFLVSFFDCLKSLMFKVDCPYTVWEFKFHATNSPITYDVFEGPSEKSFLSDDYIEFIDNHSKST